MKKMIDISVEISPSLVVWPGDPKPRITKVSEMSKGSRYNLMKLSMSLHNGSHIDAPFHYLEEGNDVGQIPLDVLVGECYVLEVPPKIEIIDKAVLEQAEIPDKVERLLLKTKNSIFWEEKQQKFHKNYCGLTKDGAQFLLKLKCKLVGIDYLSISSLVDLDGPHIALLREKVVILESINLSKIRQGWYSMYCLPLKIKDVEAAPVRVILIR